MNQPLLSTTIKKGIPLREVYKNSGSYGETDKKAYINFMKSFWKDGFPVGYYVVDGYADFYILSNIDGEEKCTTCNRNKGFHVSQLEDELTKLPDYGKTLHYEVKGEGILSFNLLRDGQISISYLEQIKNKWKIIDDVGTLTPSEYSYLITAHTSIPFRLTVVTTTNPEIVHIRIKEEEAKLIQVDEMHMDILS